VFVWALVVAFSRDFSDEENLTVLDSVPLPFLQRTYQVFRSMGLRFLPVVNKRNQIVGTITRKDLSTQSLAHNLMKRGKKKGV
jgi:chloride channel 7